MPSQMGLVDEIKNAKKSRDTATLRRRETLNTYCVEIVVTELSMVAFLAVFGLG